MAWYRDGSIAVTGKKVIGTGTNFLDSKFGLGAGQALLIPAAGTVKMYEIASVEDATHLTLLDDAGAVAAGAAYAVLSFYTESRPDFAKRLAAQLAYYQSQMDGWQDIMTGTGSVTITAPNGNVVTISSFSKITSDMASKAAKGANSDITSLGGLTTPLSIPQGGIGANTAAGGRTALGLGTAAVAAVGTGAGQIPDMSSFGSLKNGVLSGYCRLPNGIIIQWGQISVGNGDYYAGYPMRFPNVAVAMSANIYNDGTVTPVGVFKRTAEDPQGSLKVSIQGLSSVGSLTWIAIGY